MHSYIYIYMYVCIYVCIYACMYACSVRVCVRDDMAPPCYSYSFHPILHCVGKECRI